ncbi:MAG: hypothetical protein AB7P03_30935 [Kofleriaceae bacterium]
MLTLPQRFESQHSSFTISRPANHVVLVVITGHDVGEHGSAPLDVLDHLLSGGPFTLFVDARRTGGASIDVSNVWARWLRANRDRLHRIHMLTGSRFVQLTADFVRRFAELGDSMLIYTESTAFDEVLREVTHG